MDFGSYSFYYAFQYYGNNVLVFNEHWEYQKIIIGILNPSYSLIINGTIYIAGDSIIYKYDKYLNLIKQVSSTGGNRGIYYNPLKQLIYVGSCRTREIVVIDKELNINQTINTNYTPYSITENNGEMVVGDINGRVNFFQNSSIIQTQCTGEILTILFDGYNQMLVLCGSSPYMYIYHLNGSYTGINFPICNSPAYVNFDSKNRLIITCQTEIDIYY